MVNNNKRHIDKIVNEAIKKVISKKQRLNENNGAWSKKVKDMVTKLLLIMTTNKDDITMYELLDNTSADGLTLWEAHEVYNAIENKWYGARNLYSVEGNETQDVTPKI